MNHSNQCLSLYGGVNARIALHVCIEHLLRRPSPTVSSVAELFPAGFVVTPATSLYSPLFDPGICDRLG
uniref:Uncharacterized protein n=1 Tax=Onchocerca volvulus TaxID=6282 RepID=A0A8R1TTI8_ONCVO